MAIRRHGSSIGFWGFDNLTKENTGVSKPSRPAFVGYAADQVAIFVNVDQPTVISMQVAHSQDLSVDGSNPDVNNPPTTWADLLHVQTGQTQASITFTASGTKAMVLSDFVPGWIRLISSNDVSAIAGWEAQAY